MKSYVIYSGLIILLFAGCNVNKRGSRDEYAIDYSVHKSDKNICCCKYLTEDNSRFWKQDTIGQFGFRRIIAPLILKQCDLKNIKWEKINFFFGIPKSFNKQEYVNGKEAIRLRYFTYLDIQYNEKPIDSFKTQFFDVVIDKKDSVIIEITIRYQDG